MIERKIVIGLITSNELLTEVYETLNIRAFKSSMARKLVSWVFEYYKEYDRCPGRDIENIFYQKLKEGTLPKDVAEEIEQDILPSLSEEYEKGDLEIEYLLDITKKFIKEYNITSQIEKIQDMIKQGDVDSAELNMINFEPTKIDADNVLNFNSEKVETLIKEIFDTEKKEQVLSYTGALGKFINNELVKGGFVAFMGPEKRGKTWWLLDMALTTHRQGGNVLFIQAGDMTEKQQLKRALINIAGKSDKEKFIGTQYQCVPDCVLNQTNNCSKIERVCNFGIFTEKTIEECKKNKKLNDLVEIFESGIDYIPCTACSDYLDMSKRLGVPYLSKVSIDDVLNEDEAISTWRRYNKRRKSELDIVTYMNNSLTVSMVKRLIKDRIKMGVKPDLIVIDYADIMLPETKYEFRHQQNEIWKGLRSIPQEFDCLLVTATQADAESYKKDTLGLTNFSEDKRKYAHVTAMYGLNQDKEGDEKKLGLMRLNQLVIREDEFSVDNKVVIIQNLKRGKPVIESYF